MAIGLDRAGTRVTLSKNGRKRYPLLSRTIAAGTLIGVGFVLFSSRRLRRERIADDVDHMPSRGKPALAQGSDGGRGPGAVRFSLLYVLPPIWLAASLADWACHRYSRIENTARVKESVIHLLLLGEMGLPVLATAFLEITSPIILTSIAAFLVHEVTV